MSHQNIKQFVDLKRVHEEETMRILRTLNENHQREMEKLLATQRKSSAEDPGEFPSVSLGISHPNPYFDFPRKTTLEKGVIKPRKESKSSKSFGEYLSKLQKSDARFLLAKWDNDEYYPSMYTWKNILSEHEYETLKKEKRVLVAWMEMDTDIPDKESREFPTCRYVKSIHEVWKGYNFMNLLLEKYTRGENEEIFLVPTTVTEESREFWYDHMFGPIKTSPKSFLKERTDDNKIYSELGNMKVSHDEYDRMFSLYNMWGDDEFESDYDREIEAMREVVGDFNSNDDEVVKMYAKKFIAELKPNDTWDILIS